VDSQFVNEFDKARKEYDKHNGDWINLTSKRNRAKRKLNEAALRLLKEVKSGRT